VTEIRVVHRGRTPPRDSDGAGVLIAVQDPSGVSYLLWDSQFDDAVAEEIEDVYYERQTASGPMQLTNAVPAGATTSLLIGRHHNGFPFLDVIVGLATTVGSGVATALVVDLWRRLATERSDRQMPKLDRVSASSFAVWAMLAEFDPESSDDSLDRLAEVECIAEESNSPNDWRFEYHRDGWHYFVTVEQRDEPDHPTIASIRRERLDE
jgi:hypothetical protein